MSFYVYSLVDDINRLPFYIGKGKNKRAWTHLKGHSNYNTDKLNYIKNLRLLGREPQVIIVKNDLSNEQALIWEKDLINWCKSLGIKLTNKENVPPDATGRKLTEQHKQALREKNIGKKLSSLHKLKIKNALVHKPSFLFNKEYIDTSLNRNEGSKNPRAQKILVNGQVFNCLKHAREYFNVSLATFKKRYSFSKL